MTVIDLGELRDTYPPEPPVVSRRAARRMPLAVAVLLVALATMVASTPLPVRDVVVVPFRPGGDAVVADDLLLVLDPADRPGGPRSATAYRLPRAEQVWQATLPVQGRYWGAAPLGGLLLVTGYDPEAHDDQTVALDPRTGAYRWQQPGRPVGATGDGLLLEVVGADRSGTVRAVDPCCGTLRWQVPVPAGGPAYVATDWTVDRFVVADPKGRVEVRDAGSGRILTAADLPVPPSEFGPGVQVLGDLLITVDGGRLTAYGLDRLDRRWQATMPGMAYAMGCGDAVCGHAADVLTAFDAVTGRPLWTREGWNPVWAEGSHLIVTPITNTSGDLMHLVLLDPVSGSVRAELGKWSLVGRWTREEPLLAVRPRAQQPGGLVVAELDVAAATTRVIDVLPEATVGCQSVEGDLLCRRVAGGLGWWRLPR